ncbi:FAD-dependent oxidoreductase [Methanoculleus sp. FWC-SCC1]|uniref:FAD-dependent oxidoreductase n=1 Tax=Methanoculleus frigidifontis TaxID=2584085 RepID=A0ABT8M5U8_9EURY|nr:FAD-dependent oxidoreductase [Methanoculleus sp. FWC-SCC1]MDN7023324.1 FAD-dependent oxidoreductase [Methanoculleus sp. FWC-SCC1]
MPDHMSGETIPGKHESLWMATTPETGYPPLPGDLQVDVAIIGGGIAGLTTALLLKEAGRSVAVIEAGRVAAGVTGHTTAKVTSLHRLIYRYLIDHFGNDGARMYADANQAAIEKIEALARRHGVSCDFFRRPAYTFAESDGSREKVMDEADAARSLGLPAAFVDDVPLPTETFGAVRFDGQAEFHPRKYLLGLAERIHGGGSYIFERTRALDVKEGEPCRVATENGSVTADDVVLATHYPFHDGPGFYYLRTYPSRSYVLGVQIDEAFPDGMFINAESPTHSLRTHSGEGGEFLLVTGAEHRTGQGGDTREHYRALDAYIRSVYTVRSVAYHWSTQDYISVDRVPYIGPVAPGHDHLFVATGFGKWGMTNGTAAGMILADLIQKRSSPWADVFAPSRFKPLTSAKEFVAHGIDVAEGLIGERLARPLSDVSALSPGRGGIVAIDGHKTAVYRDAAGRLYAVEPVCSHMGCIVSWNEAEKSWDCPCHGSRYDVDGNILHGPATERLKQRDISDR